MVSLDDLLLHIEGWSRQFAREQHVPFDVLVQDSWAEAQGAINKGRGPVTNPVGWARTIVRRAAIDRAERERRGAHEPLPDADEVADRGQQQQAVNMELRDALDRALSKLSDQDREIVTMFHLEKHSLPEIATRLGISTDNANVRKHRALRKLRVEMSEDWGI